MMQVQEAYTDSISGQQSALQIANDNAKNFDTLVRDVIKEFNVPGVAIGLTVDDKPVFVRGYGYRDVQNALLVTENTNFPIASCTKAFTSILIAQLVDEKKLSWDDPVVKYVPELELCTKELTAKITIRDLLAHRTGIQRHDVVWFFF